MTLAEINRRIQKVEPCVELVRGKGYHYYIFDNAEPQAGVVEWNTRPDRFVVGHTLVYDSRSVMEPYLSYQKPSTWIEDGIAYGREIRAREGLPAQGEP